MNDFGFNGDLRFFSHHEFEFQCADRQDEISLLNMHKLGVKELVDGVGNKFSIIMLGFCWNVCYRNISSDV